MARIVVSLFVLAGVGATAFAQSLAPGPSGPSFNQGAIGPGGIPLAPGPSGADVPTERFGPGGIRLAPGPAGKLSGSEPYSTPLTDPRDLPHARKHRRIR